MHRKTKLYLTCFCEIVNNQALEDAKKQAEAAAAAEEAKKQVNYAPERENIIVISLVSVKLCYK